MLAKRILLGRHGASRARTGDLLGAIQALSQLSYSPGATAVAAWSGQCSPEVVLNKVALTWADSAGLAGSGRYAE